MVYVEQRFYDNGKTAARIVSKEEAAKNGYYDGYFESNKVCDIYVDEFSSEEEARQCIEDTKNA